MQPGPPQPSGSFRGKPPEGRVVAHPADDFDVSGQPQHQMMVGIIPVGQKHHAPSGQPGGEFFDHLQGQFSLGLKPLRAQRLAPIQPRQDRHGEDVAFPQRHAHEHAGDDPRQAPPQRGAFSGLGPVVIDQAHAVDFSAGPSLSGLVDHHLDRLPRRQQPLAQEPYQPFPQGVHLPARLAEEPMEPCVVRRANPRRQNHPRHGVPPLHEHRAGEQQREDPERRRGEGHRKIRQKTIDRHRQCDRIVPDNLIDSQGPALQHPCRTNHQQDTGYWALFPKSAKL